MHGHALTGESILLSGGAQLQLGGIYAGYEVRYVFCFWSGVSTLDFGEWGIVFHALALCVVQKTEVMRRKGSPAAS